MAVTKAKKIEQVEKLSEELKGASHAIVGTFAKLTVEKDFELRKAVRSAGGRYRVVKNTLAERAAVGTQVEEAMKQLVGVTSIAYTSGDPVALAKALSKYAKDNPEYTFKAGRGRRTRHCDQGHRRAGEHAVEGRDLLQAAFPDECSGATPGHRDECGWPEPGGGGEPGSRAEQVCIGRARQRIARRFAREGISQRQSATEWDANKFGTAKVVPERLRYPL